MAANYTVAPLVVRSFRDPLGIIRALESPIIPPMSLLALGLNHKTAPLEVRERVVFAPERLPTALQELSQVRGISEATIVSTCNRTEIYCDATHSADGEISAWLHTFHAMPARDVDPYLFSLADHEAVRHLLRVSSGLDGSCRFRSRAALRLRFT